MEPAEGAGASCEGAGWPDISAYCWGHVSATTSPIKPACLLTLGVYVFWEKAWSCAISLFNRSFTAWMDGSARQPFAWTPPAHSLNRCLLSVLRLGWTMGGETLHQLSWPTAVYGCRPHPSKTSDTMMTSYACV